MCVNNLPRMELDSAAAGTEPATRDLSSRKSNARPSYHATELHLIQNSFVFVIHLFACFT